MSSDYENIVASLRFCATNDCSGEGEYEVGCKAPYCCTAPDSPSPEQSFVAQNLREATMFS